MYSIDMDGSSALPHPHLLSSLASLPLAGYSQAFYYSWLRIRFKVLSSPVQSVGSSLHTPTLTLQVFKEFFIVVQTYTQFVVGFEFGSMFWLLYSIAAFLFMRLMQQKPLVEAIETISGEGVVRSSRSAIVSSGCFSAPAQLQPVTQLQEAVQVEQESPEALEATLSLSTDSFLQLVQGTLGVTCGVSTAEQLMRDSIILAQAPAPVTQPQVAVEGALASDPIPFEEPSVLDTSLLQKQVQSLSIRQAKALAKRLTTTQARIIGYSSMSLTTLVDNTLLS